MRELVREYLDNGLDRRGFLKGMVAAGFTVAAAESVLSSLAPMAHAQALQAGKIKIVEGTGGTLLVEQLKAAGIKHVFYANGSPSASMLDAMADDDEIHLILATQENIVTAMASGYAMASNTPTFVNVTTTVGTASQMANMYNAAKDYVPVVISAFTSNTTGTARDGFEQVDDVVEITKQFTRWGYEIPHTKRVPEFVRNAVRISTTPPGGPTYLAIPGDVGFGTAKAEIIPKEYFTIPIRTQPDPKMVEKAVKILLEAKKPFLYLGHEVWRSGAADEVVKIAEMLGAQAIEGFSPYSDFPTGHPLYAGASRRSLRMRSLRGADVMFNIGSHMPYQGGDRPRIPRSWKIIHNRVVPGDIAMINPTDVALVGDVKATAGALIEALSASMNSAHKAAAKERFQKAKVFNERVAKAREQIARTRWDAEPISWGRLAHDINEVIDKDAIITHEFGSARPKVMPWMEFGEGKKDLMGRTVGSALGWAVGASLGVKMAEPNRQVVCMLGDGAFLFGQVEALWAARRHEVPVMYIVWNNKAYNDTRLRQTRNSPNLMKLKRDLANYLGDPDVSFERLAAAFDVKGATVTKTAEIIPALKRGVRELREGRPFVVDVQVERTGVLAESTWYPKYSVAGMRTRKV